jgi:hypothetical protein
MQCYACGEEISKQEFERHVCGPLQWARWQGHLLIRLEEKLTGIEQELKKLRDQSSNAAASSR